MFPIVVPRLLTSELGDTDEKTGLQVCVEVSFSSVSGAKDGRWTHRTRGFLHVTGHPTMCWSQACDVGVGVVARFTHHQALSWARACFTSTVTYLPVIKVVGMDHACMSLCDGQNFSRLPGRCRIRVPTVASVMKAAGRRSMLGAYRCGTWRNCRWWMRGATRNYCP
jgi:hypothetical protein